MRTLLIAACLTVGSASAEALKIYEATDYRPDSVSAEFKVNEELGRAWVELSLTETFHSENPAVFYERVSIEGLALVNGSVVYSHEGQQLECARLKTVGIFGLRRAKATGNCSFKTVTTSTQVDDGFEVRRVPTTTVYLITK